MSWSILESGVVELPSGRRVRGRALGDVVEEFPDWGVYALARRPSVGWPSRWIRWPDFGLPVRPGDARDAISEAWRRSSQDRVEVACAGGRGRTGTVLAAMLVLEGLDADASIRWVRKNYREGAVETPWQRRWVHRLTRQVGGSGAPRLVEGS